jgi:hypothetical protein
MEILGNKAGTLQAISQWKYNVNNNRPNQLEINNNNKHVY